MHLYRAFVLADNERNILRETRIQWIRKSLQHSHLSVYNRKMQKKFIAFTSSHCAFVLTDNERNTLRETRIQWIRKSL